MTGRLGALLGIGIGLVLGCTAYGVLRAVLPGEFAIAALAPGLLAGIGARVGRAFGTPGQLRIIVFGSLFAVLAGEYFVWDELRASGLAVEDFVPHLLRSAQWLIFTIGFLVFGIFLGVRLLVGNDPLGDILEHGSDAVPPGAHGTPCARCGSLQTVLDPRSLELECNACDHRWRPPDEPAPT